jgi:hypothetical protein
MGQFSMEISRPKGSVLGGNQHLDVSKPHPFVHLVVSDEAVTPFVLFARGHREGLRIHKVIAIRRIEEAALPLALNTPKSGT